MKRLSTEQKVRLQRHAELSNISRLKRKRSRRPPTARGRWSPKAKAAPIVLDESIDITPEDTTLADILREVKLHTFHRRQRVLLDFSRVRKISPVAALYLVANVYLTRRLSPKVRKTTGTYPTHDGVEADLSQMAFFELLNVRDRKVKDPDNNKFIRFLTGKFVEGDEIGKLQDMLRTAGGRLESRINQQVYRAASEAMTNTVQHAHMSIGRTHRFPVDRNRWWLLGYVDNEVDQLTIIFCDLGWGIPTTLGHTETGSRVLSLLRGLPIVPENHGRMIAEAITYRRTRTGQSHRGKGLNDLWSLVERTGAGSLEIFSDAGWVKCTPNEEMKHGRLRTPVEGTLIKWTVPNSAELE